MTYHATPTLNSASPQPAHEAGSVGPGPVDVGCSMSGRVGTLEAAKNEATRTADRANGRRMARVSPPTSSEERKRLMSIMPTGQGSAYPERPTCAEPHADGCSECVVNVETPWLHEVTETGCIAMYLCSDCGHGWSTSWGGGR